MLHLSKSSETLVVNFIMHFTVCWMIFNFFHVQVVIPLSLYVTIELVKIGQVYFISQDLQLYHPESNKRVECRALNITEDLGQIEYVFSDKTGTLTENEMVFRCCGIGGVDYKCKPGECSQVLFSMWFFVIQSPSYFLILQIYYNLLCITRTFFSLFSVFFKN